MSGSREKILERVRVALQGRERLVHPGILGTPGPKTALDGFRERFTSNGGEVEQSGGLPGEWLKAFVGRLDADVRGPSTDPHARRRITIAAGNHVPKHWVGELVVAPPEGAVLGVSMAWGAAADTGSLLMESTGGRRAQLLPPIHVVLLARDRIYATLEDALDRAFASPPAALGIHSGPSKSADIGSTLVTGVHGPGRIIAVVYSGDG